MSAEEWMKKENTGRWNVLGPYIVTEKGERKYLCRCDCGTERYVLERSLRYGGSRSCGCVTRINSRLATAYDLKGKTFGEFTVLHVAKEQKGVSGIRWTCRCSCGNVTDVLATLLVTGRRTHCGCRSNYHSVDISGKRYDRLVAKYPLKDRDSKGGVIWHCVCDCGNEVDVPYNWLVYGNLRSCGCRKRECESQLSKLITRVDGTSLDMIKSKKVPVDNTTGVKGVYLQKGKWVAKIVFRQKQYYLGRFNSIDEAAAARREAEEELFGQTARYYDRWKAKADADPEWAAENPVKITVEKVGGEFRTSFEPVLA